MFKKIFFTGIGVLALIGFLVVFFMIGEPAVAQAQELFTLYFDIDYVREESARIFAELLEAKTHPERIGVAEEVGKLPSLSSRENLLSRLIKNREEASRALESIDEKNFSANDVSLRHNEVKIFYSQLAEFEDFVIEELSEIKTQEQFSEFIDAVFELRPDWESLLAQDKAVLENLTQLAAAYELEFKAVTYDELFRKRLVELRTPIISDEFGEVKSALPSTRSFKFPIDAQFGPDLLLTYNVSSPNIVLKYTRPDGIEINPQNVGTYGVYYGSSTTYQLYRGAGAETREGGEIIVTVENPDFIPFTITFISTSSTRGYRWPSYNIKSIADSNRKIWLDITLEEPYFGASSYTLMASVYDGQNFLSDVNFSVIAEQQTCDGTTNTPVMLIGDGSGIYSALYHSPSNKECPAVGLSTNFVVAASGKTTSEQNFSVTGELKKF